MYNICLVVSNFIPKNKNTRDPPELLCRQIQSKLSSKFWQGIFSYFFSPAISSTRGLISANECVRFSQQFHYAEKAHGVERKDEEDKRKSQTRAGVTIGERNQDASAPNFYSFFFNACSKVSINLKLTWHKFRFRTFEMAKIYSMYRGCV